MSVFFTLLFSLVALIPAEEQEPQWIAAFLNSTEQARCRAHFIKGNPYEPHFGEKQLLRVMGHAFDSHDHALLVHLDQGSLHTVNLYPHITAYCGQAPYDAVYSNVLWERFDKDSPLVIKRDAAGYPDAMSLSSGGHFWHGHLPAFISKQFPLPNNEPYAPTKGMVQVYKPTEEPFFHATVCLNTDWDGNNCNNK